MFFGYMFLCDYYEVLEEYLICVKVLLSYLTWNVALSLLGFIDC